VLECRRVRASAEVARALALRRATRWCRRAACWRLAVYPPSWKTSGFPVCLQGADADQLAGYQGPTYAMFELEFGVRMVRAEEKIRAVVPDAPQMALLNVPAGTPLLSVERVAYTYNDVPMELRRGLYRTDTHHYRNDLS
jgi:GntR family transcriptional regulator